MLESCLMHELSPSDLLILGLLAEGSTHGYELERLIRARRVREWTSLGTSSIYYVLHRLESRGLIVSHKTSSNIKGRREFRLTPAGWRTCIQGSLELIQQIVPTHAPVLVGIANIDLLDIEGVLTALQERKRGILERLEHLTAARAYPDMPLSGRLIFDHPVSTLEAELKWIESTTDVLEGTN